MDNDEISSTIRKFSWTIRWAVRSDFEVIQKRLREDEEVLSIAMARPMNREGIGVLCCTTGRILYASSGKTETFKEFKLDRNTSIHTDGGRSESSIKINSYGNRANFEGIKNTEFHDLETAIESVRNCKSQKSSKASRKPTRREHVVSSKSNLVSEMERLAKLHSAGMLTADEFASAKKKLLEE